MVKKFYGEFVLQGLCFDVQRMINERQDPKIILNLIKKKVSFLEKPKNIWNRIVWWNEHDRTKKEKVDYFDLFPSSVLQSVNESIVEVEEWN